MTFDLTPVDYDPFAEETSSQEPIAATDTGFDLTPVDYDPFADEQAQPLPEKTSGVVGAFTGGIENTFKSLKSSLDVIYGNDQGVQETAMQSIEDPNTTVEMEQFRAQLAQYGEPEGVWETIKNVGKAAWDNPTGVLHEVASQLPNSAAVMGPGAAGAAAGSVVAGPVGFIVGGILGMGFGNIAIETGAAATEQAMAGDYNRREALAGGFVKGGIVTAADTVTMGITKLLTGAAGKAIIDATERVLIEEGIDLASDVTVKAAASSPRIAKKIAAATKAARAGSKVAHVGAFAGEVASEGIGEYAGSALAPGMDANLTDAVLESILSLPQSTGDLFIGKSLSLLDKDQKAPSSQINATDDQTDAASTPTDTAFAFDEHDPESSAGWEEQIKRQREVFTQKGQPADPTDISVQNHYVENQQQMDNMESTPDFTMKGNRNLLEKNVEDYRRARSIEESEKGWEERRQAMMVPEDQHTFNRAMQDKPDESAMPMPGEMPGFQRGIEGAQDGVKYTPFSGLAEQMNLSPQQSTQVDPVTLPKQDPVNYDDGLDVSTNAEFIPSSVVDQKNFQSALGDNFGVQDLSSDDIPGTMPVFVHEVEPDKVNTDPSEAQKEAGNYKKDHIEIDGHKISIENPDGSTRKGTDESGKKWESTMNGHYGYIKRTMGKDGDQVDVIVKPDTETSPKVFVVDQVNPDTGKFDEHKVIMGADSAEDAKAIYMSNYEDGWGGFGAITEMNQGDFKSWVKDGTRTKKPAGKLKPVVKKNVTTDPVSLQVVEPVSYHPGDRVTWENKKGEVITGEIVKQGKKNGSIWHVKKPDGKIALVNTKDLKARATEQSEERRIKSEKRLKKIVKTKKPPKNEGTTYLNDNTPIDFKYEIVDAQDLITSHNDDMSVNTDFPAELQPRERSRKGSLMQVENIASKLNPARLGESANAAQGAPMIGKNSNIVESGNGRTLAIRKAYAGGKTGPIYKAWLRTNAEAFGLSHDQIQNVKNPVLVRRRQTDVDNLSRFTQQANEADTAKLSSTEQAIVDAENLHSDDLAMFRPDQDGNLMAASNKGFINLFLDKMSPEERSGYITADGRANKQLIDRVQAAVFQKAYESGDLLTLFAEEANPDIKNILNGLTMGVTNFVKVHGLDENLAGTGIVEDIVGGIELLRRAQREYPDIKAGNGRTALQARLRQAIDQGDLFGSGPNEDVKDIAKFLADNIRSGKRIGEFFDSMGARLRAYITDLAQAEMFGTKKELKSSDLINLSKEFLNEKYENKQQDLFAKPTEQREVKNNETGDPERGNEGRNEDSGGKGGQNQKEITPSARYGKKNKVFTKEGADKARELLRKKLSGTQLNSGIDPEIMLAGIQLAGYHIEAGALTFAEYSKAMVQDVGETIKPYLRSFYEGVRHYPGFDHTGMDSASTIENAEQSKKESKDVDKLDSNTNSKRDSGNTGTGNALGKKNVQDESVIANGRDGKRVRDPGKKSASDGGKSNNRQQPERVPAETVSNVSQKGNSLEKQFSTASDKKKPPRAPGHGLSKTQITKAFPGQATTVNDDGSISVRFKNGQGVQIKTVEHIGGEDYRLAVQSGRMAENGVILGKYQDGTITLNTNMADMETVAHENLHMLKALGILNKMDLIALDALQKKLVKAGEFRYDIQNDQEENQANTFAQLINDRAEYRDHSALNRIIQKVMDFFDGLVNIGRQSARKLALEYESGAIYSREMAEIERSFPPGMLPLFKSEINATYKVRKGTKPKKTIKAYKAFRYIDGKLYPMFVGSTGKGEGRVTPLLMNKWMDAKDGGYHFTGSNGREYVPTFNGRGGASQNIENTPLEVRQALVDMGYIKSVDTKNATAVAYRPGWHAGHLPYFPQGGTKDKSAPHGMRHEWNTVIAEVEMNADVDLKDEFMETAEYSKAGKIKPAMSGIRRIPIEGYYEYSTNPKFYSEGYNQDKWYISGSLKINRIIPSKEVDQILSDNGVDPQLWAGDGPLFSTSEDNGPLVSDSDFLKQKFHQKGTFLEGIKESINNNKPEFADKAIASTVDSLHFIKKRLGDEAYKLHRVLTGIKSASFSMFLEHGQLSWDGNALTVNQRKEGFLPFLRSIGDDWQNLFYWIAAKRAEELAAEGTEGLAAKGRENWLKEDDRKRLLKIVGDKSEKGESWSSLNDKFQAFNKNILDVMTEAELIDPESRKIWESNVYIPFYRVFEDDATRKEFLSGPTGSKKHISSQIKRLKGGEAQIGDPLENILKNWMFGLDAAARNKARAKAFDIGVKAGLITEVPKKDLLKILGTQNTTRFAVVKAGNTKAREVFDTHEDAMAEVSELKRQGKGPHRIEPRKESKVIFGSMKDFGILSFQKEGKPVYFRTEDDDLYQALAEVDTSAFNNLFMKMMGGAKRMLSYSATFGPAFRLRNMIRDSVHTAVVSKSFRPFVDTAIGFMDSMKESQDYIEFMSSGFGFGSSYVSSDDPETGAKFIKKILKTEGQGAVNNILTTPRKMLSVWEKIGSASENAARVGLYKNLKKEGMSNFDAGFEGRDLMDFSMHGSSQSIQTIARIVPFLNARVQGLYKLGRAARENPKAFLLKASILTAASLALWAVYKDDDRYKELEDWDKWAYYHFWLGKDHYRIPKPFEIGALFSSLPESVANVMNGTEDGRFVWDWFTHTVHDVFNVDMPQLFKPMVEVSFNHDSFRGRDIVPDHIAKLKPSEQYTPWTSDTVRAIGGGLNISPIKLEHLINGYFSTIGSMVLFGTDAVTRAAAGYPPRMDGSKNPFLLKIHDPHDPRSTKYITRFYDLYSKIDSANRTFNNYRKLNQEDEAKDYYFENRSLLNPRLKKSLNSIRKALSEANQAQRRILRSKKLSSAQKREQMDRITRYKTRITKRLFDRIK